MNILMILAHPDDEIIFGWPLLQKRDPNTKISLLTLSDNVTGYGDGPIRALQEVCHTNEVHLLDFPRIEGNFYRLPPRYSEKLLQNAIHLFYSNIRQAADLAKPDWVFTHNPMGEYGHGDHRFVFNVVSLFPFSLLLTDICFPVTCHLSSEAVPEIYSKCMFPSDKGKHCLLDLSWYNSMRRIYRRYGAWSWGGHDPVKGCKLYEFK